MKLDVTKGHYDQPWGWVAHPDGLNGAYSARASTVDPSDVEKMLVERRYEIDIIGGVEDKEASYEYDEWALCKLDGAYYLLSTSGCSCPSPSETWRVEIGPATLAEIKAHVQSGAYDGYTLPKKQESEFIALLDGEAQRNIEEAAG